MVAPSMGAIVTIVIQGHMFKQLRYVMFKDKRVSCGLLQGMSVLCIIIVGWT